MEQKNKNGIVMEVSESEQKMILMTEDGEFIQRSYNGTVPKIGAELNFSVNQVPKRKPLFTRWRQAGLAVAAVLLLLIITPAMLNNIPGNSETVAYVTVDVNPSIELGINTNDIVVFSKGLNYEGQEVIKSLNLKGLKSEKAIAKLTGELVKTGYVDELEAGRIMISVRAETNEGNLTDEIADKLARTVKTSLAENNARFTLVSTVKVDEELRLSAEKAGVSPGKYILMLEDSYERKTNDDDMQVAKHETEKLLEEEADYNSEILDENKENERTEVKEQERESSKSEVRIAQNNNKDVQEKSTENKEQSNKERESNEYQLAENKQRIAELEDKKVTEIASLLNENDSKDDDKEKDEEDEENVEDDEENEEELKENNK
ncbi:hypothetical protein GGQ84_001436 [Desulfitispora alkaliphila]|uniref:anti-sigma-I factor RsgI family protein n=1 Tax=Desulfitispora alkaliphila TaxID=622674 RepID=UPI003D24A1D9